MSYVPYVQPRSQGLSSLPPLSPQRQGRQGRQRRETLGTKLPFVLDHIFSKLKWLPIFDFIKLRKLVPLFTIFNNPDAPLCLKGKFNFLSSVLSTGLRTRACAFNLHVPYPRSNSGKPTFAYFAVTLFNCLDTACKANSLCTSFLYYFFI